MSRNMSYADYSNKKALGLGVPIFKSWEQMSDIEKENYKRYEEMSTEEVIDQQRLAREAYKKRSGEV